MVIPQCYVQVFIVSVLTYYKLNFSIIFVNCRSCNSD